MDCKLKRKYTYNEARTLALSNMDKKYSFSTDEYPIVFATIENNYYIGIINIFPSETELALGFKDVWEYGFVEPKIQNIKFLSDKEAKQIKEFDLYIYEYACPENSEEQYYIEKYDRTLDSRFKFQLPNGIDYRLI